MKKWRVAHAGFVLALAALTVAADIAGKWEGEMTVVGETRSFTMELKIDRGSVTGSIGTDSDRVTILDGRLDGKQIAFGMPTGMTDIPRFEIRGTVDGEAIKFTVNAPGPHGALRKLGEGNARPAHR